VGNEASIPAFFFFSFQLACESFTEIAYRGKNYRIFVDALALFNVYEIKLYWMEEKNSDGISDEDFAVICC
jgi:hypothetical protein